MNRQTIATFVAVVLVAGFGVLATRQQPGDWALFSPGPTLDVLGNSDGRKIISITGHKSYRDDGQLRMLTIVPTSVDDHVGLLRAIGGWMNPDVAVFPYDTVYQKADTADSVKAQSAAQMTSSQDNATAAALHTLGVRYRSAVRVSDVTKGGPADGKLRAGDLILAVDGTKVSSLEQGVKLIQQVTPRHVVRLRIDRDNVERQVAITTAPSDDDPKKSVVKVAVAASFDFPFRVKLGVSDTLYYFYDPQGEPGERVTDVFIEGEEIDPAATYRVVTNSFLATGTGDNFFAFGAGTAKADTGLIDLAALVDYFAANEQVVAPLDQRAIGVHWNTDQTATLAIPGLTSFLATNSFNGTVKGIDDIQAAEVAKYGPGEYYPIIGLTYWSFRLMMGMGIAMALIGFLGLVLWGRRVYERRWFKWLALFGIFAGFGAHAFGWLFTEVGRQPWVVYGLQKTANGVSHLSAGTVLTSLIIFVLLYGALAAIMARLFTQYARRGPEPDTHDDAGHKTLAIQY